MDRQDSSQGNVQGKTLRRASSLPLPTVGMKTCWLRRRALVYGSSCGVSTRCSCHGLPDEASCAGARRGG